MRNDSERLRKSQTDQNRAYDGSGGDDASSGNGNGRTGDLVLEDLGNGLRRIPGEAALKQIFSNLDTPRSLLEKKMPEWIDFEKLCLELCHHTQSIGGDLYHLGESGKPGHRLPLLALNFGNQDPKAPVLILTGGVHGLERIGAQVVLAYMHSFSELLLWDVLIKEALKRIRIVFLPLVNPVGILNKTRHNPNGVDLMRNAPIDAKEKPTPFVGGQRYSAKLPWFRGNNGLEAESVALLNLMKAMSFDSDRVLSVDFHSGFGTRDRIWFPFAGSINPFPHLAEMHAFKEAFERTHPHHFYQIEPQAKNYTTHGDLWDYFYELYYEKHPASNVYLPLALEMGSWMWVKKNPLQLFSALGPYNPMKPHRLKRILRRHNTLFDFMIRSMASTEAWVPTRDDQKEKQRLRAMDTWYRK